jgi:hypothetical protein
MAHNVDRLAAVLEFIIVTMANEADSNQDTKYILLPNSIRQAELLPIREPKVDFALRLPAL